MRLVAEHRSEGPRDTERVVRLYTSGIRDVVQCYGNGESWRRYIVIPRRLILNEIRRLRAKGFSITDWSFWELLPEGASELIRSASYSGPGSSFTNEPYKIRTRSRKFVIIHQSGGLDI